MLKNATGYIFTLAAIALVGIIVLIAIGKTVPTELWAIGLGIITGGLGIATPTVTVATTPAPAGTPVAAATAPIPPPGG